MKRRSLVRGRNRLLQRLILGEALAKPGEGPLAPTWDETEADVPEPRPPRRTAQGAEEDTDG